MKIQDMKMRVSRLEDQLDRHLVDIEVLTNKLSDADGAEYASLAEDLALARMKTDIMRESLDKAKDDLKSEEAVIQSSEYQDALKRMDVIKKDVTKAEKTISKTYDTLRSQLDDAFALCNEYDRLNSQYVGEVNTWLMPSYRWLNYIYTRLNRLLRDDRRIRR